MVPCRGVRSPLGPCLARAPVPLPRTVAACQARGRGTLYRLAHIATGNMAAAIAAPALLSVQHGSMEVVACHVWQHVPASRALRRGRQQTRCLAPRLAQADGPPGGVRLPRIPS